MTDAPAASSLLSEKLISFAQATRLIPPSRRGRPVHPSCIWRWHRTGVKTSDGRTVKLEAAWLVSRLVTSEEAVKRFIAAQQPKPSTSQASPAPSPLPRTRTLDRRRRDSERALHELEGMRR
jgi:hypothetical protein